MQLRYRGGIVATSLALAAAVLVTVSQSSATRGAAGSGQSAETSERQPSVTTSMPISIAISPRPGALNIGVVGAVKVTATSGKLTDVRMHNESGRPIAGRIVGEGSGWEPTEKLGYGRTYSIVATGRGTDDRTATAESRFSTVVPRHQAAVTVGSTSGARLADGGTYGVGTVIVAAFDRPIVDRGAAERSLTVTTSPKVEGAWNWITDRKAHWRPQQYYPAGTRVSVDASLYGIDLGGGTFGEADRTVRFSIGESRVTIADDATKQVSVYEDGTLLRMMPTSMGRGGTETVGGKTIAFWTQPGVYTVMDKQNPVLMDSSTYGLPIDSPSGYKISVPYAVRISPDGIYLHEREATVWAQGNTNVSAGCLNLSLDNARWFYELSRPGDVVEVRNTGGAPLEQWQNGDWSVPWSQWVAGSALRS
ncbi:MAG: Ig-like domain-containing protein [Mycobacterium kyogaense]|uniref:L,D-transpeptidase n=1 Tax=Mycobacterium kyogaense TaxID=2212479 RepID=UPI002FFBE08C